MPVLRRCAGNLSIRSSPNHTLPRSTSQNPAIMRNSVVLPQPDGPSRVKNSPCLISNEMSSTARTSPKVRRIASSRMVVIVYLVFWIKVLRRAWVSRLAWSHFTAS